MTEPLRSDQAAIGAEVPERDRDARVEELLLSGLDHYFSGRHEQAINVWTRVLFLDRGHARARAYIERARSAASERQRETEELIHAGATAFERGDVSGARRLLTAALERGAATEETFSLLERLNRLESAGARPPAESWALDAAAPDRGVPASRRERRSRLVWIAAGALFGVIAGAFAIAAVWTRGDARLPGRPGDPATPVAAVAREPLPVPAAAEVWMARAQGMFAKGRLREALTALDEIRPGDPLAPQADELRAVIQERLLESARGRGAGPTSGARGPVDAPR
jgi:hypothetical protein